MLSEKEGIIYKVTNLVVVSFAHKGGILCLKMLDTYKG